MAEYTVKGNPEVLRSYSLKMKEGEYFHRMIGQLNAEFSPFKD